MINTFTGHGPASASTRLARAERDACLSEVPTIMVVGAGDLAFRLLTMLMSNQCTHRVVLAGRDATACARIANVVRFSAANLGTEGELHTATVDLDDVDATAATIAAHAPDIIVMAASLQSWRVITQLPADEFEELDKAQLGPWLPMHLALNLQLMRAVHASGLNPRVVNAAFPDVVGPVLATVGLAPTVGAGNVGNIIPALRYGVALETDRPVTDIEIRLVTQHYFSHYVPRYGTRGEGSYYLETRAGGREIDSVDHEAVFAYLADDLKRLGGLPGQHLTASSVMRVVEGMATDSGVRAHAPAPHGLPGGYPVRVWSKGVELDLPEGLTKQAAIAINERCQQADGIEHIDADGTVTFTDREMDIMKRKLGYECRTMRLDDVRDHADELSAKYQQFASAFA